MSNLVEALQALAAALPEEEMTPDAGVVMQVASQVGHAQLRRIAALALLAIPRDEPLGTECFNGVSRHSIGIPMEVLILREGEDGLEVFLTRRPSNVAYPNQLHAPGTFMRVGETYAMQGARIIAREQIEGIEIPDQPFKQWLNLDEERGQALHQVFLARVVGEVKAPSGAWYSVEDLPEDVVHHHVEILIPWAVEAYRSQQSAA